MNGKHFIHTPSIPTFATLEDAMKFRSELSATIASIDGQLQLFTVDDFATEDEFQRWRHAAKVALTCKRGELALLKPIVHAFSQATQKQNLERKDTLVRMFMKLSPSPSELAEFRATLYCEPVR